MNFNKGVEAANKSNNLYAQSICEERRYYVSKRDEKTKVYIEFYTIQSLPKNLFKWCFQIMEDNMKKMYQKSNQGWSREQKIIELREPEQRYLVVKKLCNDQPIGFLAFKFDYEDAEEKVITQGNSSDDIVGDSFVELDIEESYREVIYCYELQVLSDFKGQGIGSFLMHMLFDLGRAWGIPTIMLTVFKYNTEALKFYEKMGFEPDISSPSVGLSKKEAKKYDYEILAAGVKLKFDEKVEGSRTFFSLQWK